MNIDDKKATRKGKKSNKKGDKKIKTEEKDTDDKNNK